MTSSAYQSTWVQNELSRAQRLGKPIFPLLREGDGPWLSVEATQYTDVRNGLLPPERFFDNLQQVFLRSAAASAAEPTSTVASTEAVIAVSPTAPAVQPAKPIVRSFVLVALLLCQIAMFAWNIGTILSGSAEWALDNRNIAFVGVGLLGMVVTGSGISRERAKRTRPAPSAWSPPSVAVAPFRLTPSFESGVFGGLVGGAVAGLLIGVLYRLDNPEVDWTIIPHVFLYGCVAGSLLGAASQLTILWFRYLVSERHWSNLVVNEVTGGLLGGALIGIPVGAMGGGQFFPRGSNFVSPALLVIGAFIGASCLVFSVLVYNYKGRWRFVARAFLTAFVIVVALVMLLGPAFDRLYQSAWQATFLKPCITDQGILIDPTGFCYGGLGALIGLVVGLILGFQIGLTMFSYRLWESLRYDPA